MQFLDDSFSLLRDAAASVASVSASFEPPKAADSASPPIDAEFLDRLAQQSQLADLEIGALLRDASSSSLNPYRSVTEAMLHLWQITPPLLSKRKLRQLLMLLRDPQFRAEDVPSSVNRFDSLDAELGTDCKTFASSVLTTQRRRAAPIPGKTQVSAAPQTVLKTVEVPYACLKTKIHRLLNDPIRR